MDKNEKIEIFERERERERYIYKSNEIWQQVKSTLFIPY